MKLVANDCTSKEVIKIVREWTELSQKVFGKTINRSRTGIQAFELSTRNYTFDTLLQIANTHNLKITIEKKDK